MPLPDGTMPRWPREIMLIAPRDDVIAAARGDELTRALIAKGWCRGAPPSAGAARRRGHRADRRGGLGPRAAAGTWTALLLAVTGTAAYAFAVPKR
ncbi:hypothetical protein ACIOJD_17985 [Streptomyces sp. NPDC088116]|uniref:hypothetical protein n=1 Tax=Streptomyces sp. NPDC088116 TaxID=3365825 RepID=UPI0038136394